MTRWEGEALPHEVEETIRRVLKAAQLPSFDRPDVEADLRGHFEDGLAAGRTVPELLDRFGCPDEAGRKIARVRGKHASDLSHGNDGRWWMSVRELCREAKLSARTLMRAPAFSLLVVTTLALGVGANTAVFTALDAVLLAPLPYDAPERLVRVYEVRADDEGQSTGFLRPAAVLEYREWDEVFESFGVIDSYREMGGDLTDGDQPERVIVSHADIGLFESLGVEPLRGRFFHEEESVFPGESSDRSPGAPVTVLSHGLLGAALCSRSRCGGQHGPARRQHLRGGGCHAAGVHQPVRQSARSLGASGPAHGWLQHLGKPLPVWCGPIAGGRVDRVGTGPDRGARGRARRVQQRRRGLDGAAPPASRRCGG